MLVGISPPFARERALALAKTPTRLTRLPAEHAKALVNWGYIATDHRIRAAGTEPGRCDLPYGDCPVS